MKKILILIFMSISLGASAQVKLSQPVIGQIQAIGIRQVESRLSTISYPSTSIYVSIDTVYNNTVSIYLIGSLSPIYTGVYSTFFINNVVATSARQVLNQVASWQGISSGGGGGAANPYPNSDYSKNSPLVSIDGKTPNFGQNSMSNSSPVVIANNQTALPVTGSFYQTTQPISGNIGITKPILPRVTNAITVGITSTVLTAANASGYMVFIQNNSANDVWISIGGTAVLAAPSILIKAGGSYITSSEFPDSQQITAISTISSPITVMTY